MKKIYFISLLTLLLLLSSCVLSDGPIYIESIEVTQNGISLDYYYSYKEDSKWVKYNPEDKTKKQIYLTFDVESEGEIEVTFKIYNPNYEITELKLVKTHNLTNHQSETIDDLKRVEPYTTFTHLIENPLGNYNTLEVPSFMTEKGIKYLGSKPKEQNFVIWGMHFNLL